MTAPIKRLRELLEKAGEYPEVEPVGSKGGYYTCPLCAGQGTIDDDWVKDGQLTHDEGLDISIVGVQVFGFGHGMVAMEQLIPAVIHALPALLDVAEAAQHTLDLYEREWPQHKMWRDRSPESQPIRDLLAALAKLEAKP